MASADPIAKVITMLSELEGKILKDGEIEQKAYEEDFEWCDDVAKEKGYEVETATTKKNKLEATIKKALSDIDDYTEVIKEKAASITTDEKDLEDATVIREAEKKEFAKAEEELMVSIDMIGRAAGIIEREMKGSALMQTNLDTSNMPKFLQALNSIIDATSMETQNKQKLVAFLQNQEDSEDDDAELGAPAPDAYKSKSGGIVDVLNDMKEKAEKELSELRKAESNTNHNYEMLKQSLTDSISAAEAEMDEAKKDMADAEETKAAAEGELVITKKDLAVAQETLDLTHEDCMQKASDHEITVKGRKEELAALGKAKKILQQMASKLVQVGNAPSFLQTKVSSTMRTSADLANAEIVNLLKKVARQHHSAALSQLSSKIATLIRYSSKTGDDPFAKIKTLINEMIAKLMKEAAAEASEKAYCDEEMGKTKAKKDELSADIEKLTSQIDTATATSVELKEEVKELQKELAELMESQAEMDKIREESHDAYVEAKADLEKGLEAIRMALEVLRDYYGSKEFLQINGDIGSLMQQPAAPQKHEKSSGAGGSIISMLEVAEADFAKNLEEEEEEEAAAQEEYDKVTQENKVTKMTKEQDVKYKTKEFTGLDKEIAEFTADRDGSQEELDAVLAYYEKIKDRCVAKPDPYEERKKRREAEIAGLKEALSILEGQAFFLQRRTSLRSIRTH